MRRQNKGMTHSPKNILIANAFWDQEVPGGSYRIGSDFARYLARKGHSVHYLCGTREQKLALDSVVDHGVQLWRYTMPDGNRFGASKFIAHMFASHRLARHIFLQGQVDVLNGHSPLQYLGATLALERPITCCYSSHSPWPDEMIANGLCSGMSGGFKLALATWIEGWLLRLSTRVQCISEFEASLLQRRYGNRVDGRLRVVPLWADYGRFAGSGKSRVKARGQLGGVWSGEAPIFFAVRRLVPRMGLDLLIEAAAILKRDHLIFRALIGGDGPEHDSLRKLIHQHDVEDRVQLLGPVSEENLPLAYRAADCVVLPSRALECFGLTILEAYAAGTPVIATPVGAIPEVIEPGLKSWLTNDVSSFSLADRMKAFLEGRLCATESLLQAHARHFDLETRAAALGDWLLERFV